ncbi:MAG: hypothetical protein IT258_08070 [Saprospiraceae bacterium]|nr:hypothetical protein [Saprospiraceae bacterium]
MKNVLFVFLLAAIAGSSCNKSDDFNSSSATLTGIDYRKCASPYCGGWFLEIDGETKRFLEIPANTDIDLNDGELEFPIPVEVEWKKYDNEWADIQDLIKVEKLFKKN